MSLALKQSYDAGFVALMERLGRNYPEELFRLEGLHPDQLDMHEVSRNFFKTPPEGAGRVTADASIDANANVCGRDVITFNHEVPKSLMKLNSLYNLWRTLQELYGTTIADGCITLHVAGTVYINDVWDIGRPYCFNFSTLDIALEGLKMGGRLTINPAKSLSAFLRQVEQFTVYAGNSTLGATGLADLLITTSWYVDRLFEDGYDNHIPVGERQEDILTYVKESLTSLIYTLNWEFRGHQSPFTNISIYDRVFLNELLPAYTINGKAPNMGTVHMVQDLFLEAYNETLARTPITFPVITACLSVTEDATKGTRTINDRLFLQDVARHNLPFGALNIYCGASSTLSSCCRLRSSMDDLGYSNTFGAGSTKIGSLGVVTINLPQAARRAETHAEFMKRVARAVDRAALINHAKRVFITDRIRRGSLPLYSLGFMDISRQYSTCGFTGLYEAAEILLGNVTPDELSAFGEEVLATINAANAKAASLYGTPHNCEQVPGESSAVKLAQKDSLLGYNPEGYELYSNQFIPLWEEGVDILDRIKVQGALDKHCTGGAVCHLNITSPIEHAGAMEALITHAAESGVVYFAVNYQLNKCEEGHMSAGRVPACPLCTKPLTDTYTRVVGFLTNTKHWNRTRREHDWPQRRWAAHADHHRV